MIEKPLNAGNFNRGTWIEWVNHEVLNRAAVGVEAAWQVKQPDAVDIYQGEYPVDITAAKPFAVLAKASGRYLDGSIAEDSKVDWYMNLARQNGAKTGIYHFLRPGKIQEQASVFIAVWNRLGGCDIRPVVDVEIDPASAGISQSAWANDIKTFIDLVEAGTGYKPIIYTSVYFWSMTGQPSWASSYDVWAAWYPYYPDNFTTLPDAYVPKGFKRWAMWQYAQDGRSQGYLANDYNMFAPWFLDELGTAPPPEEQVKYYNKNRIKVIHGRETGYKYPFNYHIARIPRSEIEKIWTTPGPIGLKNLTENFMEYYGLDIAVNMDEVITGTMSPKGWGVSNGTVYKNNTTETGVQFDQDHNVMGMSWSFLPGAFNIACGSNILVEDGAPAPGLDVSTADPRTILGYDSNYIWLVTIDGRLVTGEPGVTRYEVARWLVAKGIQNAHNLDGGGSSRAALKTDDGNTLIWNAPSETRLVINHFGIKLKGATDPVKQYSCNVIKDTRIRKAYPPGSGNPSIWGDAAGTFPTGRQFESDRVVDKLAIGGAKPEATGTWVQVDDVNDLWTAAVYNGERFVEIVDNGTPPPDPGDPTVTHTIDVYDDGSIDIDGIPYQ